jgi:hypothetical protein
VATSTNIEKMGRTAETMAKTTQQSAYTAMDYAVKAQEVNVDLLRKTTEVWIEGFRKQTELSQEMAQEFFEKAEDQTYASQEFFGQWGFPLMGVPSGWMPYDPFGFWREWTQAVHKSARDTQKTAAEQTARVVETTAPRMPGDFPIAGYDEMNVDEVRRRLDVLSLEQLKTVRDYEKGHKNRETLVKEIDRKIRATS